MNSDEVINYIQRRKRRKEFLKIKEKIQKFYPNSELKINSDNKYYLVDSKGFRILKEEYLIPDGNSIFDTWKNTYEMLWNKHIIDRNNNIFNDKN